MFKMRGIVDCLVALRKIILSTFIAQHKIAAVTLITGVQPTEMRHAALGLLT